MLCPRILKSKFLQISSGKALESTLSGGDEIKTIGKRRKITIKITVSFGGSTDDTNEKEETKQTAKLRKGNMRKVDLKKTKMKEKVERRPHTITWGWEHLNYLYWQH